ncbi:hypothetical protein F2P81_012520 [Scophthalmus maximus]|uniref:Uncharacterized protein n=1 Tax=Scophthalmus maximus TaxID=52904 RepID=A0A6A4SXK7_SCOMX|nr:hypothetical protein F2P81_012520 [Scophthalmus maximus]
MESAPFPEEALERRVSVVGSELVDNYTVSDRPHTAARTVCVGGRVRCPHGDNTLSPDDRSDSSRRHGAYKPHDVTAAERCEFGMNTNPAYST